MALIRPTNSSVMVKKYYNISDHDIDVLGEMSVESEYYMSCFNFLYGVLNKDINSLSKAQMEWIEKIVATIKE